MTGLAALVTGAATWRFWWGAACAPRSAMRRKRSLHRLGLFPAADIHDDCGERQVRADFVEKLRNSNISIFGQKPIIPRSQMRSFVRRRELAHERRKARLAEPLATKSLSACMAKKFADLSQKRSFSTQSALSNRCCDAHEWLQWGQRVYLRDCDVSTQCSAILGPPPET